jgi:hypothetical protein
VDAGSDHLCEAETRQNEKGCGVVASLGTTICTTLIGVPTEYERPVPSQQHLVLNIDHGMVPDPLAGTAAHQLVRPTSPRS